MDTPTTRFKASIFRSFNNPFLSPPLSSRDSSTWSQFPSEFKILSCASHSIVSYSPVDCLHGHGLFFLQEYHTLQILGWPDTCCLHSPSGSWRRRYLRYSQNEGTSLLFLIPSPEHGFLRRMKSLVDSKYMENVQIYVPHFALSISHATTITEPHESATSLSNGVCYGALHSTSRTRTTELGTLDIF